MIDLDSLEHEAKHEPYEFTSGGGKKKWRLPHVADLPLGAQRAADLGAFDVVMRECGERWDARKKDWVRAGQLGAAMFLEMHNDQIGAFRVLYLAHAGLKPGESRASSH